MTIGELLKKARLNAGMTQKELADKCGMADSAIRKYESGKIVPKVDTMRKISNALNVDMGKLYGIDGGDCDTEQIDRLYSKISLVARKYGKSESDIVTWINKNLSNPDFDMSEAVANRLDFLSEDMAKNIYMQVKPLSADEQLDMGEIVELLGKFNSEERRYVLDVVGLMLLLNTNGQKEALKRVSELAMLEHYSKYANQSSKPAPTSTPDKDSTEK